MKRLFPAGVLVILSICLVASSACGQSRFATIDVRKVFDGYYKKKQAEAAIQERLSEYDRDLKTMLGDYDKTKTEYQTYLGDANNQIFSVEEREKRSKLAQDKLRQLKDAEANIKSFKDQAATTLDEQKRRMRDNIVAEIRPVVKAKAEAGGYTMVFDTSAESMNSTPVVFYSNNQNDLTDAVLAQLNLGAPLDIPKTDDKPDEKKKDDKKSDKKGESKK